MAAFRIARLTLFSGPQCSLCEVGIVQYLKMSSDEHIRLDCQSGTSQSQEAGAQSAHIYSAVKHSSERPASVRPGDHQHPGKGPGKVDEEICLLDTRPASRRDGDSQGSLGCFYSARGVGAAGVREIDGLVDGTNDSFIVDTTPSICPSALHSRLYDRIPGVALGEEKDELLTSPSQDLRLCFNCGSPNHAVASCPEPFNRELVSLSRQLFDFLHPDPGRQVEFTRFYVAEGRKQQRLEWLRSYEPGVIRGPLLRDALGLQDRDPGNVVEWLRNMAYWGYPPGWVGRRNPMELVCHRILEGEAEGQVATTECDLFTVFEGADDEQIDLKLFSAKGLSPIMGAAISVDEERTRWATYPNTHFSSTALSIYNGTPLDRVPPLPSRVSVTFTPERMALWECILSGGLGTSTILSVLPWRMPGAFGGSSAEDLIPPPPPTMPPPLPLTSNYPLLAFNAQKFLEPNKESSPSFISEGMIDIADDRSDRSVVDMDVSDDSE